MATARIGQSKTVIFGLFIGIATVFAAPDVAFPFNSQVPTAARVGQLYNFQFSLSTFAPDATNFTYSLSNQPGWLSLDSATRTLSGNPSQGDAGVVDFILTAADNEGAAHMACTLVVSKDPPPHIEGDISQQLAATANLSRSEPPVVTILASSSFHFYFRQDSFIDIVQRKLYYYATLGDHTPLPSWLSFDSQNLTFSGTSPPQLSSIPQSWNVLMIASDVAGFAGTSASFTIAIGAQLLVFVPDQQFATIAPGKPVRFDGLKDTLFKDGAKLSPKDLKSAKALVPTWLSFDPSTLGISGTAPADVQDLNVTITVEDKFGDQAAALLYFTTSNSSVFAGAVGTLTARAGQEFDYVFPESLFRTSDVQIQVILPSSAEWLHFDAGSRRLSGKVPVQTHSSSFQGTITAKVGTSSQSQTFSVSIISAQPSSSASNVSATSTSHPKSGQSGDKDDAHSHLNSGVVAAVVLGCLFAAALLAACLVLFQRRKKRQRHMEPRSPTRRMISRPILPSGNDAIMVTTEVQRDIEKSADGGFQDPNPLETERAPQIALNLPPSTSGRKLKWSKRFSRISQTSSLGIGESAIRADHNIPEWGVATTALHNPHESFSVPAEMARLSKQHSGVSPKKRALRRIRKQRQLSAQSVGLGIDTGGAILPSRNSSRDRRSHKRGASNARFSAGVDGSSIASFSTRGTSVLSTRPSDFPRPPTRSTFGGSRSVPRISLNDADNRRSIRLVERSDSIADDRSMQEKRQSFIRNRASTSFASPLFAHGARVSACAKQDGRLSINGSSRGGHRGQQRGSSQLTSYSQSSSLEPPPRDPRRVTGRFGSTFRPNFPRAITQSTMGADDGGATNGETSSFYTTDSSISEKDYTAEMALPRHERSWVLPGEASPTPPPAPPASRQGSSSRQPTPPSRASKPKQKWKARLREHSSSPLSTAVAVPLADRNSLSASARVSQARRSQLSEPMSLVSNDSLSRPKPERPRLVQTNSRRPVSVEKVQRLSSLKAEAEDTRPGSEMFEALQGAGLMPPSVAKDATQKSNLSGLAFL